jgi:Flp pilus assembly secretin CpaC
MIRPKELLQNRKLRLAFLTMLVCACVPSFFASAWAAEIVALNLSAGEAYVIKNVDPDSTPNVDYADNSNAFVVKATPHHSLTVFSFQPGEGTIDTSVGGEEVTYHVIVSGLFNPAHPLAPGKGPPALSDATSSVVHSPAPYAPASAAVRVTPPATPPAASAGAPSTGPKTIIVSSDGLSKAPAADASAGLAGASGSGAGAPGAVAAASAAPAPPPAKASPATYPPDPGIGPVSASAGTSVYPPAPPAPMASASRTEVITPPGPVAPSDAGPAAGTAALREGPNGGDYSQNGWHEQMPSMMSQQFATNPLATRPEGYVNNRAFGGRHNLPPDTISLTAGMSQVYDFGEPIGRVSISNTGVADVQVLGNHELMLVGHQPGLASIVVWDTQGNYLERQIWNDLAGHQQVMLHVIIAEVDIQKMENSGINWTVALSKAGLTFVGLPGLVATPFTASSSSVGPTSMVPGGTPLPLLFSQSMTYGIGAGNNNYSVFGFFQYLEDHNLGRVLARPQLLANSGQKANFLEGGEIPIVITQALTSTIVFKPYGTSVVFIPTVIGARDIDLLVKPEVSQPDYSQGVQLFGFTVPAFVVRRAETRVRLRENQTLILAGLIQDQTISQVNKVPYLGDVPYLGGLFRTTSWTHNKTELVMSVTPEIVRPLPPGGEVLLPTEVQGALTPEEIQTRPLATPEAARPRF